MAPRKLFVLVVLLLWSPAACQQLAVSMPGDKQRVGGTHAKIEGRGSSLKPAFAVGVGTGTTPTATVTLSAAVAAGAASSSRAYLTPRQKGLCRVHQEARAGLPLGRPNWHLDPKAGWFQAYWEPW